ncbi:TPA: hypothetical protein ACTZ5N_000104 [Bacillus cereus]
MVDINNQQFQDKIAEAKTELEMTDEQLARHLRVSIDFLKRLISGKIILPVVKRKAFLAGIDRLYKRCGMR